MRLATLAIRPLRNSRRRVKLMLMATIVGSALISPAVALAHGTDGVWLGTLYLSDGWKSTAPRHSLLAVTFHGVSRSDSVASGCVNALNSDGSGWAGETFCGFPDRTHAYCGCTLRVGFALTAGIGGGTWTNGFWSQDW